MSNGWLDAFVSQHKIKMAHLHKESAKVLPEAAVEWKGQLSNLCESYFLNDIYNWNKTSIFFQAISSRSFVWQGEDVAGDNMLKECFHCPAQLQCHGQKGEAMAHGESQVATQLPKICIRLTRTLHLKAQCQGLDDQDN